MSSLGRNLGTLFPSVLGFATFFPPVDVRGAPTLLSLATGSGVVKIWSLKSHILFKKHPKKAKNWGLCSESNKGLRKWGGGETAGPGLWRE